MIEPGFKLSSYGLQTDTMLAEASSQVLFCSAEYHICTGLGCGLIGGLTREGGWELTLGGEADSLQALSSKALFLQPLTLKGVSMPSAVTWGAPTKL